MKSSGGITGKRSGTCVNNTGSCYCVQMLNLTSLTGTLFAVQSGTFSRGKRCEPVIFLAMLFVGHGLMEKHT